MNIKLPENIQKFVKKFMTKDKLLLILLVGVLLIVINIPVKSKKSEQKKEEFETQNTSGYIENLENKLESVLSKTDGVGKVKVIITAKNTGKSILYVKKNVTTSNTSESEGSVLNNSKESIIEESIAYVEDDNKSYPLIIDEEMPEITGVLVIAEGGSNPEIISELTKAVSTFLGIQINRIKIMKMEV